MHYRFLNLYLQPVMERMAVMNKNKTVELAYQAYRACQVNFKLDRVRDLREQRRFPVFEYEGATIK